MILICNSLWFDESGKRCFLPLCLCRVQDVCHDFCAHKSRGEVTLFMTIMQGEKAKTVFCLPISSFSRKFALYFPSPFPRDPEIPILTRA